MLSVVGTVLKKDELHNNAELVVLDSFENTHAFQVRKNKVAKIAFADEGMRVQVFYKNEMSEKQYSKGCKRFNNLVLIDLKKV